jgi:hypothetical protein
MNSFSDFLTHVVLRLIRITMMTLVAIFVAGFLLLGIGVALISVVWSIVRGRKPAMFTVFQFFRQASQQFGRGAWPGRAPDQNQSPLDIVDVQAHEVRPALVGDEESLRK